MRGSQLIYDGLWRCLCPAVDGPALRRAVCLRTPLMAQPSRPTTSCTRFTQTRHISAARLRELAEAKLRAPPHIEHEIPRAARLLTPKPPTKETLRDASVEEIFAALVTIRDPRGWTFHGQEVDRHDRIVLLVKHLLSSRGRTPNPFLYECMMDAMVYPQGSVKGIRKLIDDMASQNLKLTATMCQSALAALANHPDYTLRQEILDTMQDFWFTVDTTAQQKVVLGLLRDEQYELAYTRLTQMIEKKAVIPTWVFDIFIMVFGKVGFVDEMMLLLYRRKTIRSDDDALSSILYYVLDVCSSSFHLPGTLFAWNSVVRNSLLQPADGIVENVLATAARHGDASLATEALDMLSQRTRVQAYHYEAVSEAFTATGDMTGAFRTLCIMEKNGMRIGRRNTRAVYEALRRHSQLIGDAERAVRSMAQEEEGLPVAVVGVVIEAIAETQGSEAAMDLYRDVGALCGGEHVNATVMQTLLINSYDKTTLAIVKDYSTQIAEGDDPVREAQVYGTLVTKCAEAGALDLAFRFANQLLGMGGARGDGDLNWVKVLVSKAAEREDKRIWGVVDELRKDEEMGALVGRVLRQMRITRRASLRV
ncbi:pentatricopeptide repeat protein [Pochonia chlamydosporia 170]|uniref:Pentatricopeptide repeat protein n=1 Tax=Pochonia chlamydosporia 170 TaxID=1380566 RepID=A0A179G043_METCM|nr:pentatricopeptide repeat protein [Pochonia chlamydosporia 170]OAQ71252.1 pentatricopeptide repeat protein [Pochonia chlamydosporia 170]